MVLRVKEMITLVDRLLEKHPDNLFLQFLANKKVIYAIYLVIWILIIVVLYFLFIKPGNNINPQKPEDKTITYSVFKEKINDNNYRYQYTVVENDIKTIYDGLKNGDEETGYIETSEGITKYYIKDNVFNNVVNFENVPSETNPFVGTYMEPSLLFEKFDNITPDIEEHIYNFKKDTFYGKMNLSNKDSVVIEIEENGIKYTLLYNSFGELDN